MPVTKSIKKYKTTLAQLIGEKGASFLEADPIDLVAPLVFKTQAFKPLVKIIKESTLPDRQKKNLITNMVNRLAIIPSEAFEQVRNVHYVPKEHGLLELRPGKQYWGITSDVPSLKEMKEARGEFPFYEHLKPVPRKAGAGTPSDPHIVDIIISKRDPIGTAETFLHEFGHSISRTAKSSSRYKKLLEQFKLQPDVKYSVPTHEEAFATALESMPYREFEQTMSTFGDIIRAMKPQRKLP